MFWWLCSIVGFFLRAVLYFDDPAEWAKIQTYSKNTQWSILHNKIFNELFVIQMFYFMGISYQAEKAK